MVRHVDDGIGPEAEEIGGWVGQEEDSGSGVDGSWCLVGWLGGGEVLWWSGGKEGRVEDLLPSIPGLLPLGKLRKLEQSAIGFDPLVDEMGASSLADSAFILEQGLCLNASITQGLPHKIDSQSLRVNTIGNPFQCQKKDYWSPVRNCWTISGQ